jgi:hypothetical protein
MATVQEILQQDTERAGGNFPQSYAAIQRHVADKKMRILRAGDTLLLISLSRNGVANVHIATIDSPRNLVENIRKLYEAMKAAGFTKARSTVTNPLITRVLDQAGIPYRVMKNPNNPNSREFDIVIGE